MSINVSAASELIGAASQKNQVPGVLDRVLVFGLCTVLIFAIMAFGAVEEWSSFGLEAGAVALLLVWVGKQLVSGQLKVSKNPLYLPALLFFGLILVQLSIHRSAYSYVTRYEALQYVSYGILLLIAAECVRDENARKKFVLVFTSFGVLFALFAVAQDFTSDGKLFWIHTPQFGGSIYGSYVNRDHYAGLMEMLVPIPVVLSLGHLLHGAKRVMAGFSAGLMASTIFLSGSRGGMIAFVAEMALLAALIFGKQRSTRRMAVYVGLCFFTVALIVYLSKGQVLGRFADLSPDMRLFITKDSIPIFLKKPVFGWGLGTFATIYPQYRSFYTTRFVNAAHNDYAQLLVETGLLGFALMLWFLFRLYRQGLPPSRRWDVKWDRALSLAALIGCTGILLHSFVDFNLQIPANAAVFYVLCALVAYEPLAHSSRRRGTRIAEIEEEPPVAIGNTES
jgi:O-antigen ligase